MEAADDASDAPELEPDIQDTSDEYLTWKPLYDAAGTVVPSVLWPAFEYAKQMGALAGRFRSLATTIECVVQCATGAEHVDLVRLVELMDEAHKIMLRTRPSQVCLRCYHSGKGFQTSCECKGLGWLPLFGVTHPKAKRWRKEQRHKQRVARNHRADFVVEFNELLARHRISASDISWAPVNLQWIPRIRQTMEKAQGSLRAPRRPPPSPRRAPTPPESPPTDQESSPD